MLRRCWSHVFESGAGAIGQGKLRHRGNAHLMTGAKRPLGWRFRTFSVHIYQNKHPDSSYECGNRNTERNLTVRNTVVPIDEVCPPSVEEAYVVGREKVIRQWKCGGHRNRWVNGVGRGTRMGVFQTINCEDMGRSAYGRRGQFGADRQSAPNTGTIVSMCALETGRFQ